MSSHDRVACGIELAGSRVTAVLVSGTRGRPVVHQSGCCSWTLNDSANAADVKSFKAVFDNLVRTHGLTRVAIRARTSRGKFGASGVTFKMEGLIQLSDVEVTLIPSKTISTAWEKAGASLPDGLRRNQEDAYRTAWMMLVDCDD